MAHTESYLNQSRGFLESLKAVRAIHLVTLILLAGMELCKVPGIGNCAGQWHLQGVSGVRCGVHPQQCWAVSGALVTDGLDGQWGLVFLTAFKDSDWFVQLAMMKSLILMTLAAAQPLACQSNSFCTCQQTGQIAHGLSGSCEPDF